MSHQESVIDMSKYPLEQIEVDGFRGFREFTLAGLGAVNVLVGGNNCGKTSLLEAISVLSAPVDPDSLMEMIRGRDSGGIDESRLDSLRWCFRRDAPFTDPEELVSACCEIRVKGLFKLEQLRITLIELLGEPGSRELERGRRFGRLTDSEKLDQAWRGSSVRYEPIFSSELELAEKYSMLEMLVWEGLPITRAAGLKRKTGPHLACAMIYPHAYRINAVQVQLLSRQRFQQGENLETELLRHFDPEIEEVIVGSSRGLRPSIYLRHRRLGVVPLSVFGDAMRRSVLLASTLSALPPGGVLLIDEAEAGIHVEAQAKYFAWLMGAARQRQVQVFMTTHSLEALDAILMGQDSSSEDGAVVVYQLKRDGADIHSKRFAGDLLHRLRFERGLDLR